MAAVPGCRRGAALGAALALCGCTAPDSSGLYGPRRSAQGESATGSTATASPSGPESGISPLLPTPASPAEVPAAAQLEPAAASPMASAPGVTPSAPLPEAPADAGTPAPDAAPPEPEPEPEPACAGAPLLGVCWYLSADMESCAGVCATHGGFSQASLAVIGTPDQGGSIEGCGAVLEALGVPVDGVQEGMRTDGLGLGCHVFLTANGAVTDAWWLTTPALTPGAVGVQVRRACGCQR